MGYLDFFSIKIACALDFPFLPFFQKANNEGHTEVDFFIYQKTVSREKSAFGKEPNLIWIVSLWKEVDCKGFLGLLFVSVQFIAESLIFFLPQLLNIFYLILKCLLKRVVGMKWNTSVVLNFTFFILTNEQNLVQTSKHHFVG